MEKEIQNEVRVINKLGFHAGNHNIVSVLRHGWINDRYYFDMELCIFNLEDYIVSNARETFGLSKYFWPPAMYDRQGCLSLWGIMSQITNGLTYIHFQHELHRDLKPRNSTLSLFLS
jgi:serine/threonine protein kinase